MKRTSRAIPNRARAWLLAAIVAVAGCVSEPVTEPAPVEEAEAALSEEEQEFGKRFLPLAGEFGLSEYAFADRTPDGGVLYMYLPEGEELESWVHLGVIVLTGVGATWEEGQAFLPRYADSIVRGVTKLYASEVLRGGKGDVHFFHFRLGNGARAEHSLMASWQLLPGMVATFQVEQRPQPFSPRQVEQFKDVVRQLGRSDAAD